jgi:hypothetical protein
MARDPRPRRFFSDDEMQRIVAAIGAAEASSRGRSAYAEDAAAATRRAQRAFEQLA